MFYISKHTKQLLDQAMALGAAGDCRAAEVKAKQVQVSWAGEGVEPKLPEGWDRGDDTNTVCWKQAPGATDKERILAIVRWAAVLPLKSKSKGGATTTTSDWLLK